MKQLHQPGFFCWSVFNEERNIDFHSYVWVSSAGLVVIDPLALSDHDHKHLLSLGKVSHIFITNSDHVRQSKILAEQTNAKIWGPMAEKENFPICCDFWLSGGEEPLPDFKVFAMQGSKTPGELAFLVEGHTLIAGDLIRCHAAGQLCLLPEAKLKDKKSAQNSVKEIAQIKSIKAVLPGDGWPIFRDAQKVLAELIQTF